MDFKAIEEMIKTMDGSKLGYLEVNWEGISIIMRKEGEPPFSIPARSVGPIEKEVSISTTIDNNKIKSNNEIFDNEDKVSKELPEIKDDNENIKEVISPIVGTFYASSSPDKPFFVEVGSKVKKGDTLCIVEAMKLMNEIQSEFDGEIVEILVNNEEMVEYGQKMFKIKVNV